MTCLGQLAARAVSISDRTSTPDFIFGVYVSLMSIGLNSQRKGMNKFQNIYTGF
jgi:hypothetical protein